jgi:hypothetical protein
MYDYKYRGYYQFVCQYSSGETYWGLAQHGSPQGFYLGLTPTQPLPYFVGAYAVQYGPPVQDLRFNTYWPLINNICLLDYFGNQDYQEPEEPAW